MKRYSAVLLCVLAAMGYAKASPSVPADTRAAPVALRVALLREDFADHSMFPFRPGEVLRANDQLYIEVFAPEPAYVSVVLYSAHGESEDLTGEVSLQLPAGTTRRFFVPRRAPTGVSETELRVYVTASSVPLPGAARGLLRLARSATDDGGCGDRTESSGAASSSSRLSIGSAKQGSSDTGRLEQKEKKGAAEAKLCSSSARLFAPLTVIPIVIRSQS